MANKTKRVIVYLVLLLSVNLQSTAPTLNKVEAVFFAVPQLAQLGMSNKNRQNKWCRALAEA